MPLLVPATGDRGRRPVTSRTLHLGLRGRFLGTSRTGTGPKTLPQLGKCPPLTVLKSESNTLTGGSAPAADVWTSPAGVPEAPSPPVVARHSGASVGPVASAQSAFSLAFLVGRRVRPLPPKERILVQALISIAQQHGPQSGSSPTVVDKQRRLQRSLGPRLPELPWQRQQPRQPCRTGQPWLPRVDRKMMSRLQLAPAPRSRRRRSFSEVVSGQGHGYDTNGRGSGVRQGSRVCQGRHGQHGSQARQGCRVCRHRAGRWSRALSGRVAIDQWRLTVTPAKD